MRGQVVKDHWSKVSEIANPAVHAVYTSYNRECWPITAISIVSLMAT